MTSDWSEVAAVAVDLSKAPAKAQRAAGEAVRKAAFDVEARAKTLAPVDTGALRNSIGVDLALTSLEATIGPTVAYAPYVEHGTARAAPQPYMGPAADLVVPQLEQALGQIGGDIL